MADATTDQAAIGAAADKRKKIIKYAVIAAVVTLVVWFLWKKVLK